MAAGRAKRQAGASQATRRDASTSAPAVPPTSEVVATAIARTYFLPTANDVTRCSLRLGSYAPRRLRGELGTLRKGDLRFSSDKLGDQLLDWDDVAELRTNRSFTIVLQNREERTGPLFVDDRAVRIGDEADRLPRDELATFVQTTAREVERWSGTIGSGLTYRSGNTEQTDTTASALLRRESKLTRWETRYKGAYSQVNTDDGGSQQIADNHRLQSRLDWFVANGFFVTPGVDLFRDPFQNLTYRATPYVVAGNELVDDGRVRWSISAGPAYQRTRLASALQPAETVDDTFAALLSSRLSWDVNSNVDVDVDYTLTMPLPRSDEYNHHLAAILSVELDDHLDLDLSLVWDRLNLPIPAADGSVPEKDDFRMALQLGIDF